MKSITFSLVLAIFVAFVYSTPFPQAPEAPAGGGEPKIVIAGPGPGPWSQGSEQVASWWSTGIEEDEPCTVSTHAEDDPTPIFSADSTILAGSLPFPIDDKYSPGTNYVVEVALTSNPEVKGTGEPFTVTAASGGGKEPAPKEPESPPKEPESESAPPKEPESESAPPKEPESESAPPKEPESESAPPKEPESESAPPKEPESESAPPKEPESPPKEPESESAPPKEPESESAPPKEPESESAPPKEPESESAPPKEPESPPKEPESLV